MSCQMTDPHDRKLYHAVKAHKPLGDGLCQVRVNGRYLSVFVYGARIFSHDRENGYWEASSCGMNRPWMRDKMNACLSAIGAPVRVYTDERGKFWLTTATATVGDGRRFNSTRFGENK